MLQVTTNTEHKFLFYRNLTYLITTVINEYLFNHNTFLKRREKMKSAAEVKKEVLEAATGDVQAAIKALCDGAYLAEAGYTDDDQEAIEIACDELRNGNIN